MQDWEWQQRQRPGASAARGGNDSRRLGLCDAAAVKQDGRGLLSSNMCAWFLLGFHALAAGMPINIAQWVFR